MPTVFVSRMAVHVCPNCNDHVKSSNLLQKPQVNLSSKASVPDDHIQDSLSC